MNKGVFPIKSSKAKVVFYKKKHGFPLQYEFLLGKEIYGKTDDLKFNLLGGTCNHNESIIECATRELYEETAGVIPKEEILKAIYNEPGENVVKYNLKLNGNLLTIFVFFISIKELDSTLQKNLIIEFNRRREIISEILKEKRVFDLEIKKKIKTELKLSRDIDKISKSYIKHFFEINKLDWLSFKDLSDIKLVTRFVKKINKITYQQGNKIIKEDLQKFLSKKKK